jgi:hypothetical protein
MADNDQSIKNLRYNQVSQGLEGFGGGSPAWTPLPLLADGGMTQLTGEVTAGPGSGSQVATITDGVVVDSIHADAHALILGDVQLVSGTNVTLTQVGQAITINASGGSAPAPNIVSSTTTAYTTTTSQTYVTTPSTVTITASSNTAKIKITAVGLIFTNNISQDGVHATIFKDGVNLAADSLAEISGNAGDTSTRRNAPATLQWLDTPGDTSPHTYTVRIRNDGGVVTVAWGNNDSFTCTMVAEEVH